MRDIVGEQNLTKRIVKIRQKLNLTGFAVQELDREKQEFQFVFDTEDYDQKRKIIITQRIMKIHRRYHIRLEERSEGAYGVVSFSFC